MLLAEYEIGALIMLLVFVMVYDASDYVVGSGASNAIEGPLAGMLFIAAATAVFAVVGAPPFRGADIWTFSVLAMLACPAGQILASALLPEGAQPRSGPAAARHVAARRSGVGRPGRPLPRPGRRLRPSDPGRTAPHARGSTATVGRTAAGPSPGAPMDTELDRILADDYLADLAARPFDELRALRSECQTVETQLSYLRRMVQGRHDIVAGEIDRRGHGGDRYDVADLVDRLPSILADRIHAPGPGRLPAPMEPGELSGVLADELAEITSRVPIESPGDADDEALAGAEVDLRELERKVSTSAGSSSIASMRSKRRSPTATATAMPASRTCWPGFRARRLSRAGRSRPASARSRRLW